MRMSLRADWGVKQSLQDDTISVVALRAMTDKSVDKRLAVTTLSFGSWILDLGSETVTPKRVTPPLPFGGMLVNLGAVLRTKYLRTRLTLVPGT